MNRLIAIITLVIALTFAPASAHAQSTVPLLAMRVDREEPVRNGPGLEFTMVGSMAAGTVMQVTGCDANCSLLEVAPSIWIAASQVTPVIATILPDGSFFAHSPSAPVAAAPLLTPIPTSNLPTVAGIAPTDVPSVAIQTSQQMQPISTPTPGMLQAAMPTPPSPTPVIVANPTLAPTTASVSATQPAAVATPSSPAAHYNRYMVGNAQPSLPPLSGNDFDVIILKQDESSLWLFIRNNTSTPVRNIGVDVIALAPDGSLLGTDGSLYSVPFMVYPGEVTYMTIDFDNLVLPSSTQFDFAVKSEPAVENEGAGDMTITEHNRVQDNYVGMATNYTRENNSFPTAQLLCFDESGNFLADYRRFASGDFAAPGVSVAFQVGFGANNCLTYLLWVS